MKNTIPQSLRIQYLKITSIILEKFNISNKCNHTVRINECMGEEVKEDCL